MASGLRAVPDRTAWAALRHAAGTENENKVISEISQIRKAPAGAALHFALEVPGPDGRYWSTCGGAPAGLHKPWLHMTEAQLGTLTRTVCPELAELRRLSVEERGAWGLVRITDETGSVIDLRIPPTLAVRGATREMLLKYGERCEPSQ